MAVAPLKVKSWTSGIGFTKPLGSEYKRARSKEPHPPDEILGACAHPFGETDPDRALAILVEGRALAEALGERWWKLILDYWHLGALLHFKRDYRRAVELAVRNTVAVSRPENVNFPVGAAFLSIAIWRAPTSASDPEGYAAERIRETLTLSRPGNARPSRMRLAI